MFSMQKKSSQAKEHFRFVAVLVLAFCLSTIVTCALLHLVRETSVSSHTHSVVGSIRIEEISGKRLHWDEDMKNISISMSLKKRVEKILRRCLYSLNLVAFEIIDIKQDPFARVLKVRNRGILFHWRAVTLEDIQISKSIIAIQLMECDEISFEPESFNTVLGWEKESRSFDSLETYLLDTDEEFNLKNIEFPSVKYPEFVQSNVSCPPLKNPEYGLILPVSCTLADHISVGKSCKFSCMSNRTMSGEDTITCLSTGSWNNVPPICTPYCTPLPQPYNGGVYPSACTLSTVVQPGLRCFYFCDSGYLLDGNSLTCSKNGQWKGNIPFCKKTCAPLSRLDHGYISPALCFEHRVPHGFECSFDCEEGFTVSGNPSLLCDVDGRWSAPQPTCRKGCPLLTLPTNTMVNPPLCSSNNVKSGAVMEGTVCSYLCTSGYLLHGNAQRMCGEGGMWTGTQPECKRICGPFSLSSNMNALPKSCKNERSVQGMQCDLICGNQYTLFGDITSVTCLDDGNWSVSDAICYRTCPPLTQVLNGAVLPDLCHNGEEAIPEGTECEVHCSIGFFILGNSKVFCSPEGVWSGDIGECHKKCERLLAPDFGFVTPINCSLDEVFEGTQCHFSCKEKYSLNGKYKTVVCLGDGSWEGYVPECISEDKFMIVQDSLYYQVCMIANIFGVVSAAPLDECPFLPNTQWWIPTESGQFINLALNKCMQMRDLVLELEDCDPENKNQKFIWIQEEDFESFSVNPEFQDGYSFFPYVSPSSSYDKVRLYLEKQKDITSWFPVSSTEVLSLFGKTNKGSCPMLRPSTSIVKPPECINDSNLKNGTVCYFSCKPGYKLYGVSNRTCLNGQWSHKYPTCKLACLPLSEPLKGNVTTSCMTGLQDHGTVCFFQCIDKQHRFIGESLTTCLSNGQWSSSTPSCTELCPPLQEVLHGVIEPSGCVKNSSIAGRNCYLRCTFPYILQGSSNRTCMENHQWTNSWTCVRGCFSYSDFENGYILCDNEPVYAGTSCNYTCNVGYAFTNHEYQFNETVIRVCQPSGLFNGSTPFCKMPCSRLHDPTNGSIMPQNCTSGTVFVGEVCQVTCDMGYRFEGQSADIACLPNGVWKTERYECKEEIQFLLYNDVAVSQVCGRMDEVTVGSLMKKLDLSHYNCHHLMTNNLWTWEYDMLKHVTSGLCLAVQDISTQSFSLIILRSCDQDDTSQQWTCKHEYMIKLSSKPLYMSASSADNSFIIVKDHENSAVKLDFMWKSSPVKNRSDSGSPCKTKLKKCRHFDALDNGIISPKSCYTDYKHTGSFCNITCNKGYLLSGTALQTVSLSCKAYGAWRASTSLPINALPPKCLKSCPALQIPLRGNIEPLTPCTNGTSLYGTICHFSCGFNNFLEGPEILVCGLDGTWSELPPLCRAICVHVAMKSGAHANSPLMEYPHIYGCVERISYARSVKEGSTCFYFCSGGMHVLRGAKQRTCLASGNFDQPLPNCSFPTYGNLSLNSLSDCPYPPGNFSSLYNCFLNYSDPATERLCANYTCDSSHILVGEAVSHCNIVDISWPTPPTCKRE